MWGVLLVGLLIEASELLMQVWPLLLVGLALYALSRWVVVPVMAVRAAEARDRLRHEQARREIDRIAADTCRAMHEAAITHSDVIEGTAVEIEPR